ncbi:MAG: hypothetical protein IT562_06305 [Alphaproteobacteria bacterium]|nr:hypothetical protein [Alphaproteobacteria bacterium]
MNRIVTASLGTQAPAEPTSLAALNAAIEAAQAAEAGEGYASAAGRIRAIARDLRTSLAYGHSRLPIAGSRLS